MKRSLPTLALLFLSLFVASRLAGQNRPAKFVSKKDVFGARVFVENRGQFSKDLNTAERVYYVLNNDQEKIYFTAKGLVHVLVKKEPLTEAHREAMERGEEYQEKTEAYYIHMNWLNANSNLSIEPGEKQGHYFTYGEASLSSSCYKKLVYKNVYNNIDIEYTFPQDKEQGIKYNVIIRPGGNPADVKIAYTGDVSRIKLDAKGNVIIKTPLEDLIEYAPQSFYSNRQPVASEFALDKKVLSFRFPNGYEAGNELIIDPWVTALTTLSTNNYGYDVDYDDLGNVFVYGGNPSCKVSKYSPLGALIWTFSGVVASPSWSAVSYGSNFVVMKANGKAYLGQGFNSTGTRIIRLDASGAYDNVMTPAQASWNECWDMAYHCSTGNIYGLGGGTSSNKCAGIVDQTTGTLTAAAFYSISPAFAGYDIASHAIDDAGEVFWIYASGFQTLNNTILRVNAAFTSSVWAAPTTFNVLGELQNKNFFPGGVISSNGFNCLAVNNSYLYYYDGKNLAAYNKTNGAIVASVIVPGQSTPRKQGGIAVDDCNNLYLGGDNTIICYNFTGSNFNTLPTITVAATSPSPAVCDIAIDRVNKILYVSGGGFVASLSAIHTLTCNPLTIACYNPNSIDQVICAGTTVSVVAVNYLSLSNPTYSLNPGGLTNSTGTFVLTPTVNTSYTTYVTGTNTLSTVLTLTSITNVTVHPQPQTAPTVTQLACTGTVNAFNLNLTFLPSSATPNYTITWAPTIPNGIFSPTQTAANGGIAPGTYTANILTSNGCATSTVITINPSPEPANFNISGGNVVNCYNPTLTVNYTPATHNYTTTNGVAASQTGASAVFTSTNAFGVYTISAVNPTSGCVSTKTMVITQNTVAPTSALSPTFQNITCSVSSIQMVTATANPTVNVQHVWLSPQGGSLTATSSTASFLPGGPGTYTHMVVNITNGCSVVRNFTVASTSGFPTYSVVSPQNFTLGCTTKSVASISIINGSTTPIPGGPISYTILGPPTSTATPPGTLSPQSSYTVNVPGTWTVITKDNTNLCETRTQISVISNTAGPKLDTLIVPQRILNCDTTRVKLEAFTSTPNSSYTWMFPGTPNTLPTNTIMVNTNTASPNTTTIATYTLVITDNNNTCVTTTVVTMSQNIFPPKAGAALGSAAITCITSSISLTNISSTGIPPNSIFPTSKPVIGFTWLGPTPQTPLQVSSTYVGYLPGTYTLIVKDLNNGCISFTTATILDNRDYPDVDRPSSNPDRVIDCGSDTVNITANFTPDPSYSYTWTPTVPGAFGNMHNAVLTTSVPGTYFISITNTKNGCQSSGVVNVIGGSLKADFIAQPEQGYAPVTVNFTNTSTSTNNNNKITTIWNFGNGTTQTSKSAGDIVSTLYTHPGTYTVTAYVIKGNCVDTASKTIRVELPSLLEIPNVFSPNGDGVNDVFFLKTSNIDKIDIKIFDRWGHKVYDLVTEKGNIAWDGTNQQGKEVAEGVYMYILKASGKDGQSFERKGNITLVR